MVEVLAIVPARGESKGLLGKNLRALAGHPLIAYSVAAGIQATLVNRVICSTDSEEIAQVAREYDAEVPFMRLAELAQDDSPDIDFFNHVLAELAKTNYSPYKMWVVNDSGTLDPLLTVPGVAEPFNLPRQELPEVRWHIGVLDLVRTDVVTQTNSLSGKTIIPLKVDRAASADIDTLDDFERAEKTMLGVDCVRP